MKKKWSKDFLAKIIYFEGHAEKQLIQAISYFEKAIDSVNNIDCPDWKLALKLSINDCKNTLIEFDMLKKKQLERIK